MDILNNSNCLNGGNNGSAGDVLKSKNSNNNFQNDSDNNSSHSFNSISSTPNSLISTPSPSSTDNTNSLSGNSTHNHLSQASNSPNDNNLNLLLKQYSLMSNNGSNNPSLDSISQYFNSESGGLLNGYLQEFNRNGSVLINKNQNKSNTNSISGSNRKKPSSNTSVNSVGNTNSKPNGNNSTIPPGLHNFINKSSMVNGQAMNNNSKPKNLRTLMNNNGMMNNNKSRLANGEIGNNGGNKFNDSLYSPGNNVNLNNLQSSFQQAQLLHQQQQGFNNFHLSNGDNFDLPSFNRSNSNSFLPSSLNASNTNNSSWISNVKSGQDHTPSTFDELFGTGGTSPFKNSDTSILNSGRNNTNSGNKFSINQTNTAGEIGAGIKNGPIGSNFPADSLLSELSIPKRDIWLHGNETSSSSQLSSFFDNTHTQDIITSSASVVNPVSTSASSASSSTFENVWSNSALNSFNSWPDFASFSNFSHNSSTLDSSNNITAASDFDMKKLLALKNEKISSLLDNNTTPFDMKGRSQINEIMAMFKKYILEVTLTQDIHLCSANFENYYNMMKSDLAKFEASTFTIEELKLFQELYTALMQSKEKFNQEKHTIEDNFEQFTVLVKNLLLSSASGSLFMFDDNLLRKIADKLANAFNVLYSAKYNNIFLGLVKFYKKMIYSIPNEILNNLPIIIKQSKMLSENSGNSSDPLFMAYRNFIMELNKYNNHNRHSYQHNNEEDEVDSVDDLNNIKNKASDMLSENKDVNNNKKIDNLKDCNKISNENEIDIKSKLSNKQACLSNKAPPIFSHVSQIKSEVSVYMPFYYPVDHNMLSINGPISIFCNRIKVKSPFYMSPNRQTFEYIVDGELQKALPGPIVLEKSENLATNKSFNKLVRRLRKHFPNLAIKQLVELAIQSKYAIMKKHKHQYGFSGFKTKDLVKYIVEYICENAIPLSVPNSDAMKGVSSAAAAALAAKGVSWSMVASANSQPNGQLMMSPSTSGAKDSASVVSSNASPSPSPSLISNPSTPQICALCKNIVTNNSTDEKRKMAIIACSHIFHKECIDFWTKINPVCPLCDQFILRNEEFPSL